MSARISLHMCNQVQSQDYNYTRPDLVTNRGRASRCDASELVTCEIDLDPTGTRAQYQAFWTSAGIKSVEF